MNVFVLCAGRTASTTFAEACSHIEGYTSSHESLAAQLFSARLDYPNNHIEVDNRLAFFLGSLDQKYGDNAYYVHLTRDESKVAASYRKRWYYRVSIVRAFYSHILMTPVNDRADYENACKFYVETNRQNIHHFLKDKTHTFVFELENAKPEFERMVSWLGKECDQKGYEAWDTVSNVNRQAEAFPFFIKLVKRIARTIRAIPHIYWDS